MITFRDGPLQGVSLELARAPLYLRAVIGAEGTPDALDALDDTPRPDERVIVYRREGAAGSIHLDYTEKRTGRRRWKWLAWATYAVLPEAEQPEEAVVRDTARWREWASVKQKEDTPSE